jgi:hypothetical protein
MSAQEPIEVVIKYAVVRPMNVVPVRDLKTATIPTHVPTINVCQTAVANIPTKKMAPNVTTIDLAHSPIVVSTENVLACLILRIKIHVPPIFA